MKTKAKHSFFGRAAMMLLVTMLTATTVWAELVTSDSAAGKDTDPTPSLKILSA